MGGNQSIAIRGGEFRDLRGDFFSWLKFLKHSDFVASDKLAGTIVSRIGLCLDRVSSEVCRHVARECADG